jgi:hypothetical protein
MPPRCTNQPLRDRLTCRGGDKRDYTDYSTVEAAAAA